MKEKRLVIFRTIDLLGIILLYYITGSKSIFLYVLSISLYNVFVSSFNHISLKERFSKINSKKTKEKIFKYLLLIIGIIACLFLLLSILISDLISVFLKLDNILPIFIIMGICTFIKPFIHLLSEYLGDIHHNSNYYLLENIYQVIDNVLLLIIALFCFLIFKLDHILSISLLYLSKILGGIIILVILYMYHGIKLNIDHSSADNLNYKKEVKAILKHNSYRSLIEVIKNSYYYISLVILYVILSKNYHYQINDIERILTFTYFYALGIIDYLIYLAKMISHKLPKEISVISKLYQSFKMILTIMIILGIISPLICKIIFLDPSKSIYLVMVNVMGIFILLYDITYEYISNKRLIYISLIIGLIIKIVTIIPMINAFYRMGYNLLYGDILSTIMAMFLPIIINYIYIRTGDKSEEKYFEKILNVLYENIILAIILILVQFVIPYDTDNYFAAIGLTIIYLLIGIIYIKLKNKK